MILALIACSMTKAPHACEAQELYEPSRLFRARLAYARAIPSDEIRILSARHHLVELDEVLAFYQETLSLAAKRRAWGIVAARKVASLVAAKRITRIVVLAGKDYMGAVEGLDVEVPFAGLGIGARYSAMRPARA